MISLYFVSFEASFEVRKTSLNLRYNLCRLFSAQSSDFASCSLALHVHMVTNLIKRLITFASLELSTLVLMFFIPNIPKVWQGHASLVTIRRYEIFNKFSFSGSAHYFPIFLKTYTRCGKNVSTNFTIISFILPRNGLKILHLN